MIKESTGSHCIDWKDRRQTSYGETEKTFTDWPDIDSMWEQWNGDDILKICLHRNEHLLNANINV